MDKQTKEKIIKRMSQVGIGEKLGVSSQAVGKWLRKGNIPPRRVIPLCQILNWEVTPHEVDPMSYPNPTDGLPKQEG